MAKQEKPPSDLPKKRVWRRRLAWLGLVFIVGLCWLNGPGFRWGGTWAIRHLLESKGYAGPFQLKGSVWSGPQLESFEWKHSDSSTALKGESAAIGLRWGSLLKWDLPAIVDSVVCTDVAVVVDAREPAENEEEEPKPKKEPARFPLSKLPQPLIALDGVSAKVLLPEDKQVELQDLKVSVRQGMDGEWSWKSLSIPQLGEPAAAQGLVSYTATGVKIENLSWLPEFGCEHLEVAVTEDRDLELSLRAHVHESKWKAFLTVGQGAVLAMDEGERLDLSLVQERWLPDKAITGNLTEMQVKVDGMSGPWPEWNVEAEGALAKLGYESISIHSVNLTATQTDTGPALKIDGMLDAENEIHMSMASPVLEEKPVIEALSWEAELNADSPALVQWLKASELPVEVASLEGGWHLEGRGKQIDLMEGEFQLGEVKKDLWVFPKLSLKAETLKGDEGSPHRVGLTDPDGLLNGTWSLDRAVNVYTGELAITCPSLARLQPQASEAEQLSGAIQLNWKGQGKVQEGEHGGEITLTGNNVGPAANGMLYEARLKTEYGLDKVLVRELEVETPDLVFRAKAALSENAIEITEMRLLHDEETWLDGRIHIPLATEVDVLVDRFWKATEPVVVEIQSEAIPCASLAALLGKPGDFAGSLALNADIGGLPSELGGTVTLVGKDVGLAGDQAFPATGDVDFAVVLKEGALQLDGKVVHAHLEPISLGAKIPFQPTDAGQAAVAPLQGHLKIPSSSLAFLSSYLPILKESVGQLAADVTVSGTVSEPKVEGTLSLDAERIRFDDVNLPQLDRTRVRLKGTTEGVDVEDVSVAFDGGTVGLTGRVDLASGSPTFDLNLKARQALLSRDENMVARANADVSVQGPYEQVAITGTVRLVESRYFQEIELIPTNQPTTSLPQSKNHIEESYGTDKPPFKDWRIDVRVLTEEPFRVRTNLAAADIGVDLRVAGPGSAVRPSGKVDLSNAYAQLPFSRLDLKDSAIHFTEASGFPGILDIRGESRIRDYQTRVVVNGSANDFHYVLTSSPPLPEEEIMALLATGTTREDLVGGGQAAASRAALLLFDKIWRKVAKKDWEDPSAMREKRLTFESGHVNRRTGATMTTARLRLSDHWSLTGDADIAGDFRGLLHYVFEF